MRNKLTLALILVAGLAGAQTFRTVVYDSLTRESLNYVKFMVPTNVYMGYDLLTNPEQSLVGGTIDWSVSKMAEVTYAAPLTIDFLNLRPWVTYTLRLNGTHAVTWPESISWLPLGTTNVFNIRDTYQIYLFADTNTQYVVKVGAGGGGGSGDASLWSSFPAIQTVDFSAHSTTNVVEYGFTNRAALYVEGSNLMFRTGQ